MKKKLLCLFICITMLMSVTLTGCGDNASETGENEQAEDEVQRSAMTLSLWLPTNSETTDEAIELVEREINILTQAKYKTAIELHAIPEDEYDKAIDDRISEINANIEAERQAEIEAHAQEVNDAINGIDPTVSESENNDEDETSVETEVNEYGQSVEVYPEVSDQQLDIFLIHGYDTYKRYVDDGLVEELSGDLNNVGSKLTSYIHPTFFNVQKYDNGKYCVPNNHTIGEYQLLLVNKALAEKYSYSASELTSFLNCKEFMLDVGAANENGVTPLLGMVEPANIQYFSIDGERSLIAQRINPDDKSFEGMQPLTLAQVSGYIDTISLMKQMQSLGYVGNGNPDTTGDFAVGVVTGDASLFEKYEDEYYINVHAIPIAEREDVFQSVFAVSSYTKDTSRCMEIITYLNTDQTLRTLLQYGVEGVNWELDDSGEEPVLKRLNHDYMMNITDTGNVFMTYPDEGVPMSEWDKYKDQNLDSYENPYIGYEILSGDAITEKCFTRIADLSKDSFEKLDAATFEDFASVWNSIRGEVMRSTGVVMSTISDVSNDTCPEPTGFTFKLYYDNYLK